MGSCCVVPIASCFSPSSSRYLGLLWKLSMVLDSLSCPFCFSRLSLLGEIMLPFLTQSESPPTLLIIADTTYGHRPIGNMAVIYTPTSRDTPSSPPIEYPVQCSTRHDEEAWQPGARRRDQFRRVGGYSMHPFTFPICPYSTN